MLKFTSIILFGSLFDIALGLHAFENLHVTRQWSTEEKGIPIPVKVNNHVVTVALNNKSIHVESAPEAKIGPCDIPIDRDANIEIIARALGNGKIIVGTELFGETFSLLIIVVDPFNCTANTIELPVKDVFHYKLPITFYEHFDVFPLILKPENVNSSSIIRLNDKAERIYVPYQLDSRIPINGKALYIYVYNASNPSSSYLIASTTTEGATLNTVNSTFDLTGQSNIEGAYIYSCSTGFDFITACYKKQNRLICEFRDWNLVKRLEVPMMHEPNSTLYNAWVANLPDGSAMVLLQHRIEGSDVNKPNTQVLHVQRAYPNGTTGEPLELAREEGLEIKPRGLVMDNGEYCVTFALVSRKAQDKRILHTSTVNSTCVAIQ